MLNRRQWILHDCSGDMKSDSASVEAVGLKIPRSLPHTILNIEIDVYLLQSDAHAGAPGISEHDEFGIRRRLVEVNFVLTSTVGDKARSKSIDRSIWQASRPQRTYLSSSPPSLRTMFRKEKTVPNTNLASSSVIRAYFSRSEIALCEPVLSDVGREDLPDADTGRGSQRRR